MELLLIRNKSSKESTIGELTLDGKHIAYTLEDVVRPKGEKVFGKTAIPTGRYEVVITFSNRFQVMMPLLVDVPGYSGVRLHWGNYSSSTDGCLLVGTGKATDMVTDSRKAYAVVHKLIEDGLAKGKVFITIK